MEHMKKDRQALILFAHGARDPRWADPLNRIQALVKDRAQAQAGSNTEVYLAFLELMKPTLPELMSRLQLDEINTVTIVPIFLGQGAHVRSDLPALVDEMRLSYPKVKFSLATAIGENEQVLAAIANVCLGSLTT